MSALYLHLPFCQTKCHYCSFVVSTKQQLSSVYLQALHKEAQWWKQNHNPSFIKTLYLGGGTPSLLKADELRLLLSNLQKIFDLSQIQEQTLEANPESVTLEAAHEWLNLGFNRVSLGVQSFQNEWLSELGRNHVSTDIIKAYDNLRKAGFSNISLDLMFGLPYQHLADWKKDLEVALKLQPEHISIYHLTIEKGSKWYHQNLTFSEDQKDLHAHMYEEARSLFKQTGFEHYEVASFAKENFRSKHNQMYWNGENYIGLGTGAHSFFDQTRFANLGSVENYLQTIETGEFKREIDKLSPQERLREALVIGLRRLQEGVDLKMLENKWHVPFEKETQDSLQKLSQEGLIDFRPPHVKLTDRGVLFADKIASELI